uniref:YegS/DAGK C-terminal domain-containing protein n=1 Tax=Kalanchoe fedtschenkoi TaxID=63787 RepID=A0A7N0R8D5_KALFE
MLIFWSPELVFVVNPKVGGDGTLHELQFLLLYIKGAAILFLELSLPVENNDREATHSTALGDNNPHEAIEQISEGLRSRVDVGVVNGGDGEIHYLINVADIHLSAKAGYYSARYKIFGNLCYVIGALQGFMRHNNLDLKIKIDDGNWEMCPQVTAMCIGNAKFFFGGMKITPNADPSSGSLEVVTLQNFKWYNFIPKMHMLLQWDTLICKKCALKKVKSWFLSEGFHAVLRHVV